MDLRSWVPTSDLSDIRERIARLSGPSTDWTPAADWYETDDDLILVLDLPGADPVSLELAHDGEEITVAGQRDSGSWGRERSLERPKGPFQRTLRLPESVEPGSAEGQYRNGLLEVRLRKLGRTITVDRSG
jgi:HSP20 family protein